MIEKDEIIRFSRCPACKNEDWENKAEYIVCANCHAQYSYTNGALIFQAESFVGLESSQSDGLIFRLKMFFKKFPKLFYVLAYVFGGQPVHRSAKDFLRDFTSPGIRVINLGSGTKDLGDNVINVDYYPFSGVSVVADAHNLPFLDNSIDLIVCDYLLEHVPDPDGIIREIHRVLKPTGKVYLGVPFIINYHSAPADYHRWTLPGVRNLMKDFHETELKVAYGPTAALSIILTEWVAILFSFNINFLYQIILIIMNILLVPLKFLDFLLARYSFSQNIAMGFYFIGSKK